MKKISVFNHVTVDGFYAGANGEVAWFYTIPKDDEWENYTRSASGSGNALIYGRITYDMMKSYWPTPQAIESFPDMAKAINLNPKIVFSKTMGKAEEEENWKNVTLMNEINPEKILKLKEKNDITILGSGSIIQQFTNLGLIDEYLFAVVPVVLGAGKSFFTNVKKSNLELINSRSFKNGLVLLHYGKAMPLVDVA